MTITTDRLRLRLRQTEEYVCALASLRLKALARPRLRLDVFDRPVILCDAEYVTGRPIHLRLTTLRLFRGGTVLVSGEAEWYGETPPQWAPEGTIDFELREFKPHLLITILDTAERAFALRASSRRPARRPTHDQHRP